jgi:DNA-binding MarR family transcriptional regulator
MGGFITPRPPGGRGVARPVRAADGHGAGDGTPGPHGAGAGGDGADGAAAPNAGSMVPDGGSVAAGAVWGALIAARDDEALSAATLARRARVTAAEVARALERFEAAELVLRVPRGRRAGVGWMLAGGVREGLGIARSAPAPGYGHGPALLGAIGRSADAGPVAPVAEADLPLAQRPAALPKPPRLAKGELEARTLATLRTRYPQEFGPLGLSRELGGYSSGAVSNALERLHAKGLIVQTSQAPKRYAALPPEAQPADAAEPAA